MKRSSYLTALVSICSVVAVFIALSQSRPVVKRFASLSERIQERLQRALAEPLGEGHFPEVLRFDEGDTSYQIRVSYTLDTEVQRKMERLLQRYRPDYGAFVALDAETGQVLALVSYSRERDASLGNLALRATYPAASIFKVVTATAALDQKKLEPDSVIAFNGGDHTLYRRNVTSLQRNRWTRFMSLKRAFARSVNTVFGLVGIHHVGGQGLAEYAERFFFNRPIPGDLPVQGGSFGFEGEDAFSLAEVASGYNRVVRMSPLQGALIAAAVANDGTIMEPHLVRGLLRWDGTTASDERGMPLYVAAPRAAARVMGPDTAYDLRKLMKETVRAGTAVSAFAGVHRRLETEVFEIGGKTGSLRGDNPRGNNDWFVGYALAGGKRVAMAALAVNVDKWRIKSSQMAREFLEAYFGG